MLHLVTARPVAEMSTTSAKYRATFFILNFIRRWLHALHENIASPHIRKLPHIGLPSSTHYGVLGNLCVYICIMSYREGRRV
jgi:hypothetical protein